MSGESVLNRRKTPLVVDRYIIRCSTIIVSGTSTGARDENITILEEAAAIQMCMLYDSLVESNQPADVDSIAVHLMTNLLQIHEKEMAYTLKNIDGAVSVVFSFIATIIT